MNFSNSRGETVQITSFYYYPNYFNVNNWKPMQHTVVSTMYKHYLQGFEEEMEFCDTS